ncbi:HAD family hydrolase [Chloroflexota bacterium]
MGKNRIRALILDFGGVISLPQNSKNLYNIVQTSNLEHNDFMKVYLNQRANYDNGRITGEQYWLNILQYFGFESKIQNIPSLIKEDIASWTVINDSMIHFISEIRGKFFKLAIISNMNNDVLEYLRVNFRWFELFDELIFSCEVGINKPNREIYKTCLRELNLPASDCLFVDDSLENVRAARELDMHAIQFGTMSEFIIEFKKNFYPFSTA